jgi:hypothetical protein
MTYLLNEPWLLGLLLAVTLAGAIELGRRTAACTHIHDDINRKDQMVAIRDGLFVLVSLLLGFTLALAVPRYTERRTLLVEEAISIGTTYLRAAMLPPPYRDNDRALLRHYVDARLDMDSAGRDAARFNQAVNRSRHIQAQLWADIAAVAQTDRTAIAATYINSLNETIDLHDKRIAALENRIPVSIWFLILSVSRSEESSDPFRRTSGCIRQAVPAKRSTHPAGEWPGNFGNSIRQRNILLESHLKGAQRCAYVWFSRYLHY